MFSEQIFQSLMNCEETGDILYRECIAQRLQVDSTVNIFDPLKKANVKTCKSANKKTKTKVHDRVVQLQENCNLFARCALIQGKRDIDMKEIIGQYELTAVPYSLFSSDGAILNGGVGKAGAVSEILTDSKTPIEMECRIDVIVIDAMALLHEVTPKPPWIKLGSDLAMEFNKLIDSKVKNAPIIVVYH